MTDEDLIRNYETCKKLALTRESQTNLLILKEKFKDVINSPRSFEKINDLESLLKILEKRGELSETDIHLLEYVYSVLGINTKILENHNKLIERKCTSHRGESFENLAPSERASAQDKTSRYNRLLSEHVQNERPHGHATPRLSERVVTEISTRIGQSWRSLARYLKVQECKIDSIARDPRLTNNEVRTRAMLDEYERRVDPVDMKKKLLNALKLADRRDLHHDIETLFLREL